MKKPKAKHIKDRAAAAETEEDQNQTTTQTTPNPPNQPSPPDNTTESQESAEHTGFLVVNDTNAESVAASAAAIALSALNNEQQQLDDSNNNTETDVEAQLQREIQNVGEIPLVYSAGPPEGSQQMNVDGNVPAGRKNKHKADNAMKEYIDGEPTEHDVLMGRGGRSNHHPGNARYLQEKLKIQTRYRAATKEEKTSISQELVDAVQNWGGRFLKLDGTKWYKVDNTTARKKASQTLREDNTPEHRAQKRAKYTGSSANAKTKSKPSEDGVVVEGAEAVVLVGADLNATASGPTEGDTVESPMASNVQDAVVQEASV